MPVRGVARKVQLKHRRSFGLFSGAIVAAALLLSGCSSVSGRSSRGAAARRVPAGKSTVVMLQKGMLPADVRALLGEPKSIQPFRQSETQNEVWTYLRTVTSTTTTEATRTRQVPYFDPFLNAVRMIDEPDY